MPPCRATCYLVLLLAGLTVLNCQSCAAEIYYFMLVLTIGALFRIRIILNLIALCFSVAAALTPLFFWNPEIYHELATQSDGWTRTYPDLALFLYMGMTEAICFIGFYLAKRAKT